MNTENPWFIIIIGFLMVFLTVKVITTLRARKMFKDSFYTELYSGFFEYNIKRKKLKRLSTSYWVNSQLGDHRIFYQMVKGKDKVPQAYILLILTSGVYTILCKSYNGELAASKGNYNLKRKENNEYSKTIKKIENPANEIKEFNRRWKKMIGVEYASKDIIVFNDKCDINIQADPMGTIPFVNRRDLFVEIKNIHKQSPKIMDKIDINILYNKFSAKMNVGSS